MGAKANSWAGDQRTIRQTNIKQQATMVEHVEIVAAALVATADWSPVLPSKCTRCCSCCGRC